MNADQFPPSWLQADMLPDERFQEAYDLTPDQGKAVIKQLVSRLYARFGQNRTLHHESSIVLDQGVRIRDRVEPPNWALVTLDMEHASPVRLVAAVMPLVLAGTPNILVVRVKRQGQADTKWPPDMLTGLELAGQENACDLGLIRTRKLFQELASSGLPGAVVELGHEPFLGPDREDASPGSVLHLRPAWDGRIGVWMDQEASWDLDMLSWAHPDARLCVWSHLTQAPPGMPENSTYTCGTLPEFFAARHSVVFVPPSQASRALDTASAVYGPGMEGSWVWPGLRPEVLRYGRAAWLQEPGGGDPR